MKKLVVIALVVVLVLTLGISPVLAGNGNGNGKKPGTDFSGPHYNLNIIGKKADWNGGGSYDNPDRHTMFVPADTTGWTIDLEDPYADLPGIKISMTQGSDWAVLDGNAFDDGECAFQLAPGHYKVYIVAKAKPGGYTDITGWVYAEDEYGAYYYFDIGSVHVTKSKKWNDATHIFYVSAIEDPFGLVGPDDVWVFEYLSALVSTPLSPDIVDASYFWQYDNHGNKLVKVRFYPD